VVYRDSRCQNDIIPLTLQLPYPPSANRYYRRVGSKTLISAEGRAYRLAVVAVVARAGWKRSDRLQGRLAVQVEMMAQDRRKRDLDNICKATLDALTHASVWADDGQIDDLRLVRGRVCPEAPGLAVTIEPLDCPLSHDLPKTHTNTPIEPDRAGETK
jgi:crossover junction endodeoxyribonuclease RusA